MLCAILGEDAGDAPGKRGAAARGWAAADPRVTAGMHARSAVEPFKKVLPR
jgi:uncharacterized protein YciI